ncbi:hypothetical protein BDV12DRAFT_177218 [Aspergillus spectabilis]
MGSSSKTMDHLRKEQNIVIPRSRRYKMLLNQRQHRQELIGRLNNQGEEIRALTDRVTVDLTDEERLTMVKFNESQVPNQPRLEELLEWFLTIIARQEPHNDGLFSPNRFVISLNNSEGLEIPGRWLGFLNPELEHTIRNHAGPVKWASRATSGEVVSGTVLVIDYSEASLKRRMAQFLCKLNEEWVASMNKVLGNSPDSAGALSAWTIPDAFFYASLSCFSYSADKNPFLLSVQEAAAEEDSKPIHAVPNSYGRVWNVQHKGDLLTVGSLLFLIWQLDQTYGNEDPGLRAELRVPLFMFLQLHIAEWASYPKVIDENDISQLSMQLHFRVFRVSNSDKSSGSLEDMVKASQCLTGIRCQRNRHGLPVPSKPNQMVELAESRCSIYLSTLTLTERPVYQVLSLRDFAGCSNDLFLGDSAAPGAKHLTGLNMFLDVISRRLNDWQAEWTSVLDAIESILVTEMQETLHNSTQEELIHRRALITMKSYFTVLQTLRICRAWIHEVTKDLDNMKTTTDKCHSSESLGFRWDSLQKQCEEATEELVKRIGWIEEEFKSLQDGLINITSVVESTKSSTMNRYILIFTVATIIYLPMSFVTSVFGMHLFDYSRLEETQHAFYITMVLASALTYLGATLAVFGIHQYMKARAKEQAPRVKQVWDSLVELFSSTKQFGLVDILKGSDWAPDWDDLKRPVKRRDADGRRESV